MKRYQMALAAKAAELEASVANRRPIAIEYSAEETEQSVLAANREISIAALDRDTRLLREVQAALERIRDGSYGTCEGCGEQVKPRRLDAVPWARYCVGCQDRLERTEDRKTGDSAAWNVDEPQDTHRPQWRFSMAA